MIIATIRYSILVTPKLVTVSLFELTVFVTFNLERGNLPMRGVLCIEYDFNITIFGNVIGGGFRIAHHPTSVWHLVGQQRDPSKRHSNISAVNSRFEIFIVIIFCSFQERGKLFWRRFCLLVNRSSAVV